MTIYCKLVALEEETLGYITYVFECLEPDATFGHRYVMTTRWPNWQHKYLELGEIGYLTYKEVVAGVDTWYDGDTFIPYNYSNIIFIKFIEKEEKIDDSNKDIIQI